jgi:tetratricopeptide (TPR) repeat protein
MSRTLTALPILLHLAACSSVSERGTLAELDNVEPDTGEVLLEDGLALAAQSYRRYLEETPRSARTPEAMRRLADLQIEQEYGVIAGTRVVELPAPDAAITATEASRTGRTNSAAPEPVESEQEFEQRASQRVQFLSGTAAFDVQLPESESVTVPAGPREAIDTYREILETYPHYERNDQVLYQMSRAFDEIGQPDDAMTVMDRLVAEYPFSKYIDEVYFRRGEFFFVRKKYLDAEAAYGAIINLGPASSYHELALYKLGWALYKQELYEEALHNFVAMLDHRLAIGYDFDEPADENDQHRVTDTFRVISLSFSNLGGPEVVDEYFSASGQRSYADKIYGNLGEFYFGKLRYEDAASVYKSFVKLNPFHKVAPYFSMRVVEIYDKAGFPQLVVESKKEFASNYALDAAYWNHVDVAGAQEVVVLLKTNLTDLANHYHALYQEASLVDERPGNFIEAERWYSNFLSSFPADTESPQINYQFADLLLENEDFGAAAREYERTAYRYDPHEQAAAAGYAAVYAHRENLKVAADERHAEVRRATVSSSLQFAETFPEHEQAPVVLGAAADDLYEMGDFQPAIDAARALIDGYPAADVELIRSAWTVIAHSSIDLAEFANAEQAYLSVLALTPAEDESRAAIVDGLAAAIYKQGEQSRQLEDFRAAADHFLRVKELAPTSNIRTVAEYDAATALIELEDWSLASGVLEEFRADNPEHELNSEATKQLAFVYREDGQIARSAAEHERIAAESADVELAREALLVAGDFYDEAGIVADTVRVYEQYVTHYPRPLDIALETRNRLAEIFKAQLDYERYYAALREMVAADRNAGEDRTDRSRYLAAMAALVLSEQQYEVFAELRLTQPFDVSLEEKQRRMDVAMEAFESLVSYEVAEVTAAATFYIAEIYLDFSTALLESERPSGLSAAEKADYELVIEEEAFPFEERAIEFHEKNFELLATGIFNPWVQKSLAQLGELMPGRYAKDELSGGFVGSLQVYAYRMPNVPTPGVGDQALAQRPDAAANAEPGEVTVDTAERVIEGSR